MNFAIVYFPIEATELDPVTAFVAELRSRRGQSAHGEIASPMAPAAAESDAWGPGTLTDLYGRNQPLQRTIVTRMATASVSGKRASYEDIRQAMEQAAKKPISYEHVRGNLAWISKYARIITGKAQGPFELHDLGAEHEKGNRYEYSMPKALAEAWLAIVKRNS